VTTASLSALVAALLSAAIGLSAFLENRHRPTFRAFAGLCFCLFGYHLGDFIGRMTGDTPVTYASYLFALGVPLTSLRFFRTLLAPDAAEAPGWDGYALTLSFLMAALLGYLVLVGSPQTREGYPIGLFTYVVGAVLVCAVILARRRQKLEPGLERARLGYLAIGLLGTVGMFGLAKAPDLANPTLAAVGVLLTTLYLYFLSQNLSLHRLLDLQEVLARVSILSAMVLLISAVYGILLAWLDPGQPGLFLFNTLMASVIVLILIDPLRSTIEERVNRYLFREKVELRAHLTELGLRLRPMLDPDALSDAVMQALQRTRRVTHAALYVASEDGAGLNLRAHLGPQPPDRLETGPHAGFLEHLKGAGILVLDPLVREQEAARRGWAKAPQHPQLLETAIRTLRELQAGVCVPLLADEQVLGLLCLADDRLRDAYSDDELDLVKGVAGQIALSLQNSRLFKAMQERDRLAVLGQMAAGLAHEIRNPLGAIKGAAQYLRADPAEASDGGDGPAPAPSAAEVGEFLDIIIEEVDRLNRVVSQFLNYARPDRGKREMVQVNEVVRRTVQVLEPQAPGVEVRWQPHPELPPTRGNAEQLQQVFLNLGLNAVQAMPDGGVLTLATRLVRGGHRQGDWIEVSFQDTGVGIPTATQESLFIPFFTTKSGGTGLGLPISQRLAENHGGTIRVYSEPGQGATFTLSLPLTSSDTTTQGG
jgi:signal transduction histidine kinase